uniref:Protein kinase domain-containing protein n=1 Tax=Rhabditophanes sp. KR3021 TaxID=114890 RepID=A0AC35U8A3_9BILA
MDLPFSKVRSKNYRARNVLKGIFNILRKTYIPVADVMQCVRYPRMSYNYDYMRRVKKIFGFGDDNLIEEVVAMIEDFLSKAQIVKAPSNVLLRSDQRVFFLDFYGFFTAEQMALYQVSNNLRRLQVVAVIDNKYKKSLSIRKRAREEVLNATKDLSASITTTNLNFVDFERLDYRETGALDLFYNADVAVVDVSLSQQQPSLSYHLGVRESMGQTYNIIISMKPEEFNEIYMMDALKESLTHTTYLEYELLSEGQHLICRERNAKVVEDPANEKKNLPVKSIKMDFRSRLTQALKNVQTEASAHARDKFLSDLRKVHDLSSMQEQVTFLDNMKTRLDNPDVLSVDTVHQFMLSYRDVENYDGMITLVNELKKIQQTHIVTSMAVRFLYAFALNRRNAEGDREKALKCVQQIIEDNNNSVPPDVICLGGRIYKDMFISSNYDDKKSLEEAINWYRKAFEISPLEHSGINLATLMRASGEQFEYNTELQKIAVVLNSLLGRKGTLETLTDYWDIATFFEVSVLAEDYNKACDAALKMVMIKPPTWFLKSTMENIKLINRCAACVSPVPKEKQIFFFWSEFFMDAIDTLSPTINENNCFRCPILIQEVDKSTAPSILSINASDETILLVHVLEASAHHDFNIIFSNAENRNRVVQMINDMDTKRNKVLPNLETKRKMEFEYENQANGDRVILGKGTFGIVYQARDKSTQSSIAIKQIEVKNDQEVQPLMEEIQLHSTLSHRNIVRYLGSQLLHGETANDAILIFMEQVPGGSLSKLLRQKWGPLDDENTMVFYATQILEGLNYLHEQKIVHRDIKGDNVLVNTYTGVCKISDFGTCKRLAGLNPITETFKGTLQYMAPEVIDHGQRGYGAPADIWSYGECFHEKIYNIVGMYKTHPPIPDDLSDKAKIFIKSCFNPDPQERRTTKELLQDPWVKSVFPEYGKKGSRKINAAKKNKEIIRTLSHSCGMMPSPEDKQPIIPKQLIPDERPLPTKFKNLHPTGNSLKLKNNSNLKLLIGVPTPPAHGLPTSTASAEVSYLTSSPGTFNNIAHKGYLAPNCKPFHGSPYQVTKSPCNLQVSQPTSPLLDSITNSRIMNDSPMSSSPSNFEGGGSMMSPYVLTGVSTTDEHNDSNRFFMLKKDSQIRSWMIKFMTDSEKEIIDGWIERIRNVDDGLRVTVLTNEKFLSGIILAMRNFFSDKDIHAFEAQLIRIKIEYLKNDDTDINVSPAVHILSNLFQKLCKKHKIKPHWMFCLDDMNEQAVQVIYLTLCFPLNPGYNGTVKSVHDQNNMYDTKKHYLENNCATADLMNTHAHSLFKTCDKDQMNMLMHENKRLYAELFNLEKQHQEFLKTLINSRQSFMSSVEDLNVFANQSNPTISQSQVSAKSYPDNSTNPDTLIMVEWLHSLNCDNESIDKIVSQNYTKFDLIQYVTREELLRIGVSGGTSCKIWREIQKLRGDTNLEEEGLSSSMGHQ